MEFSAGRVVVSGRADVSQAPLRPSTPQQLRRTGCKLWRMFLPENAPMECMRLRRRGPGSALSGMDSRGFWTAIPGGPPSAGTSRRAQAAYACFWARGIPSQDRLLWGGLPNIWAIGR